MTESGGFTGGSEWETLQMRERVIPLTGDDLVEALIKEASTPVDMRFMKWTRSIGLPENVWPSLAYAVRWGQMTEDEKNRFV